MRVGVIGVGYVASNNFLPVFPRFDDVELAGIMANHLESVKKAQRLCGAQEVVESLEALVKLDLDCAFVLTPKACHAEQISFLLKAGVAFKEKNGIVGHTIKNPANLTQYEKFYFCIRTTDIDTLHLQP